jgi:(2Fe-2S) ferredoxin
MTLPCNPTYYQKHVFFCLNQRVNGEDCCANYAAKLAFDHCKKRIKDLGLAGAHQIRINKAGCLDRCASGPVMVVYPEGVCYTYFDIKDIDDIIDNHLCQGKVVQRLVLPTSP